MTGSISAYKSAFLVRELVKAHAEVRVIMTPSACEFITPLTLSTLSKAEAVVDMFPKDDKGTWHIHLASWADAMMVAPASANTIAKLAHGFADNAVTSLALALRCPLIVAPAMDTDMLVHPATQANLDALRSRGATIIDPEEGELASGLTGPGRLPDFAVLIETLERVLGRSKDFEGLRVLVTAGPTHEAIDPVRFIGNHSTGKMGFAVGDAAAKRGAVVTLISGPVQLQSPPGVHRIDVRSASQMADATLEHAEAADVVIMTAAVADYRPESPAERKMKKADVGPHATLHLVENPDILKTLGSRKKQQTLVGFALETNDGESSAREKLVAKNADMIVLNDATEEGSGFGSDTNRATFLFPNGSIEKLEMMSKGALADLILDRILSIRKSS